MKVVETIKTYGEMAVNFSKRNKPELLTVLGLVGLGETAHRAYVAGLRAKPILDAKKKDLADVHPDDKAARRTVIAETAKELVPVLGPTIVTATISGACIIGSNRASNKRIAALSAAYSLTETAFKDYKRKATELLGEKKATSIRDAISREKVQENPPSEEIKQMVVMGNNDVLCLDEYSGRYFYSNAEKIGQAINRLSARCVQEIYVSLNDFYEMLGLRRLPMGEDLGWNVDFLDEGRLPITWTAVLSEENRPVLAIQYDLDLRADYRSWR